MNKPGRRLRAAWIIPNVFLYFLVIGTAIFILTYQDGLQDTNLLAFWLTVLLLLFGAALYGTYRILDWMKQGKL